jgi:hypothetical protein
MRGNQVVSVEFGIAVRAAPNGPEDDPGVGAVVSNNLICVTDPNRN